MLVLRGREASLRVVDVCDSESDPSGVRGGGGGAGRVGDGRGDGRGLPIAIVCGDGRGVDLGDAGERGDGGLRIGAGIDVGILLWLDI